MLWGGNHSWWWKNEFTSNQKRDALCHVTLNTPGCSICAVPTTLVGHLMSFTIVIRLKAAGYVNENLLSSIPADNGSHVYWIAISIWLPTRCYFRFGDFCNTRAFRGFRFLLNVSEARLMYKTVLAKFAELATKHDIYRTKYPALFRFHTFDFTIPVSTWNIKMMFKNPFRMILWWLWRPISSQYFFRLKERI